MRTDNLRVAVSLANRLAQLREVGAPEAKNIERLLFPFARSIPGANETGQPIDPKRVVDAAQSELSVLDEADLAERRDAVTKFGNSSTAFKLWGRPVVIDNEIAESAIR